MNASNELTGNCLDDIRARILGANCNAKLGGVFDKYRGKIPATLLSAAAAVSI